jgi:signal transduction histidine kinase
MVVVGGRRRSIVVPVMEPAAERAADHPPAPRRSWSDWLLPALLVAAQLGYWPGLALWRGEPVDPTEAAVGVAATVLIGAALVARRRAPVAVLAGVLAALTLGQLATPWDSLLIASAVDLIVLYSVGAHRPVRTALGAAAAASGWLALSMAHQFGMDPEFVLLQSLGMVSYLVAIALGQGRRRWRLARRAAADRLAEAETRRRQSAVAERHRLARELHDTSAHQLTAIVVTVSAARRLAASRPELAADALAFAARTGRETLVALRQLVAVLRQDEREAGPPLPDRIGELAAGFGRLGQPVTVRLDLPPAEPPTGPVAEAAYGIVREALTNSLRYAPGAAVRVGIGQRNGTVEIDIRDGGPPRPSDGSPTAGASGNTEAGADGSTGAGTDAEQGGFRFGSGHGLAGAAERAAELGGSFAAGPEPGGGWRVHASLPTRASPPTRAVDAAGSAGHRTRRWLRPTDLVVLIGCLTLPASMLLLSEEEPGLPAGMDGADLVLTLLLLTGHALPLLWRRRAPWLALAGTLAVAASWTPVFGYRLLPEDGLVTLCFGAVAELAAVYAVAVHGRRRGLSWLAIPVSAAALGLIAAAPLAVDPRLHESVAGQPLPTVVFSVLLAGLFMATVIGILAAVPVALAWGVGYAVRRRQDRVRDHERSALAEATARVVAEAHAERERVAAGLRAAVLHDAGRLVEAADQARLDEVAETARAALTGMRGLLGDLRDAPTEP